MKVQKSKVDRLIIEDAKGLDPITVFIEDFELGKGAITIKCWGDCWSYWWGAIGNRSMSEFLLDCSNDYLIAKLSDYRHEKINYGNLKEWLNKIVNKQQISEDEKTVILSKICLEVENSREWLLSSEGRHFCFEIVGHEDWEDELPMVENPDYKYLSKIIDTVKEAIK